MHLLGYTRVSKPRSLDFRMWYAEEELNLNYYRVQTVQAFRYLIIMCSVCHVGTALQPSPQAGGCSHRRTTGRSRPSRARGVPSNLSAAIKRRLRDYELSKGEDQGARLLYICNQTLMKGQARSMI